MPPQKPTPPPTDAAPQKPIIDKIMSDEGAGRDFLNLEHDEQIKVLSTDPEFKKMQRLDQDAVLSRISRKYQPAGLTPGLQKTLSREPRGAEVFLTDPMKVAAGPVMLAREASKAPLKTAAITGKEFVAQPLRELAGEPQPGEDRDVYESQFPADEKGFHRPGTLERTFNFMDSLTGGDPAAARESLRQGDKVGAYAHLLATPLFTFGFGKLMEMPRKNVSATRREISSLQAVSKGAIEAQGPEKAAARMEDVQKLIKSAMQNRGVTDQNVEQMFPTREKTLGDRIKRIPGFLTGKPEDIVGKVNQGNQRILDISKDVVELAHKPIDAVLTRFGTQPTGPVTPRIVRSMFDEAAKLRKVNPSLANAIEDVASRINSAKTFDALNEFKTHANKMVDQVYSAVPGQAIDATAERTYAYKLAADTIRNEMYPELQRVSGSSIDLARVGQREADAIAFRDGVFQHYFNNVAPQQMSKEASNFFEYVLAAQGSPGHSFYSRHIAVRALEKSGAVPFASGGGQMSKQFRRGAGPIGKGMEPEKIAITPGGGKTSVNMGPPVHTPPSPTLSHVVIGPGAPGLGGFTTRSINVHGQSMGSLVYDVSGDTLTIHHMGGPQMDFQRMSNMLGHEGLKQMLTQLTDAHPNVQYIQGIRVGGARGQAGRTVRVPVSRLVRSGVPPGISIIPYKPGTVKRFPGATKKAIVGARAGKAAEGAKKIMTPPPEEPEEDEDQTPPKQMTPPPR